MSTPGIAIAGGGAAGLALALALHKQGLQAEVFDAGAPDTALADKRILALSHGSMQTLDWLGVWPALERKSAPITTIHVSQQGGLGRTRISAAEQNVAALGYVCPAAALVAALAAAVNNAHIPVHHQRLVHDAMATEEGVHFRAGEEEYRAALLAYAEGAVDEGAHLRQRDYGQHAITCTATLALAHQGAAWERFTSHGPVALLPFAGGGSKEVALVYTCPAAEAEALQQLDDDTFITRLQAEFNGRIQIAAVTQRHRFPLGLRYRDTTVGQRQVWLGNAAQTLHPVAGQGYNLALRDIRDLARTLADAAQQGNDPGAAKTLQRYAARRRLDRHGTIGFTDGLVRLFSNDHPLLHHARGAGLLALDLLPPLRSFVANRMMFGARAFP
ncbi:MAG: 2-octaprenyl-6-methoxyphenyl hydroxylase [Rhodocyclaceae bacterium]|nr:MAG: 2-octaprenyl-6-methoxyphenyl hydroxylase [Rhodocyclaceae bacterium]